MMASLSPFDIPNTIEVHRARQRRLSIAGQSIAYVDAGPRDGDPVVLLHGMPTSSWLYRAMVPPLTQAGLRVIVPDMIGFGASSKPRDAAQYGFALQAERLRDLMTSLGISRWTQVVHDLGGPWTWELADRFPETLGGLIVMNTTSYLEGFSPPSIMKLAGGPMGGLMAFMMGNSVTGPSQIRALFRQMMVSPSRITQEMVRGHALPMTEGTTQAFLAFARGFGWWFGQFDRYQDALRRLKVPAATIWGRHDKVLDVNQLPAAFARDLEIPIHRQHVLDAGHFLQEECPDEVAACIVDFMLNRSGR